MNVFLVRHAESVANAGGRTTDPANIPLSPAGQSQATAFAEQVKKEPTRIISSSFLRAIQTAQPLAEKYGIYIEVWPELREFNYLDPKKFENTTWEDRLPARKAYYDRDDIDYDEGEGTESFREFVKRVNKVVSQIKKLPDGQIYIFSHEIMIWAIYQRMAGISVTDMWEDFKAHNFSVRNTELNQFLINRYG